MRSMLLGRAAMLTGFSVPTVRQAAGRREAQIVSAFVGNVTRVLMGRTRWAEREKGPGAARCSQEGDVATAATWRC
jgi:hypothetical protein